MPMQTGLTCRDIGFSHRSNNGGEQPVLQAISAHFPAGQTAWISGPTGAGKSTLLHLLAGLRRPCRGEILADGEPVSRWLTAHRDRWRRQLGIIFQQDHLIADLTVAENVILPLIPKTSDLKALRSHALQVLKAVDLEDCAGRKARALSGGERQRAAAARALVHAPRFLLADEPFAHQDSAHARTLLERLQTAARNGSAVIIAAHETSRMAAAGIDHHWHLTDGQLKEVACPPTPC